MNVVLMRAPNGRHRKASKQINEKARGKGGLPFPLA